VSILDPKNDHFIGHQIALPYSVCMCDSRTNHSSRFVPVAGSKIEHVLFATGCRYR